MPGTARQSRGRALKPREILRIRTRGRPHQSVLCALLVCSVWACRPDARSTAQEFGAPTPPVTSLRADALEWNPSNSEAFPAGVRVAGLQGDPEAEGPYTFRASFPDGYRFPAHRHAMNLHMTIIAGTYLLAEGERFDFVRLRAHEPGDFLIAPARGAHYGGAEGETVVQFHGIGPFTPVLVDPYLPDAALGGGR